jgi:hypothetical protein
MNIKLVLHAFICLLTLCASSNAQQTFKPKDKEPGWNYNTIAELHGLAKKHLDSLDTQIADKNAASKSALNLFKETAKKRYNELVKERKTFLNQTWTCPYRVWQTCSKCKGWGREWLIWTCSRCHGGKGYHEDSHPTVDAEHSCSPNTIGALLKVAD